MNRHLIWIIAGTSVLGLGVPALAAARSDGTPDDNGVPGEVRGNCDEAEHANDPDCLRVLVPAPTTGPIVVTVPPTSPSTIPSNTTPSNTTPGNTTPGNTTPGNTTPGNTAPSNTAPSNTAPGTSVASGSPVDVSGRCDEPEHASDPRCTGVGADDNSGRGNSGAGVEHDHDDDSSARRRGDDDDRSGRSGSDDHDRSDDDGKRSGHGGGDD